MSKEERTHEYYERVLLHTECKTAKGKPIKPIEYFDKIDAIAILDSATNGDMIQAMFPNGDLHDYDYYDGYVIYELNYMDMKFDKDWWYARYKRGGK